jgi:quercetin dioxygenase-like cupin family protein
VSEPTRRIVTGHLADGRSVVVSDASVPNVRNMSGAQFDEVWSVASAPAQLGLAPPEEPTSESPKIALGSGNGNLIRIIEFASARAGGTRSPMHRTRTIDYGIVLEGEMVLHLSDSEVNLGPGDVVIQRGTDHAWENRSAKSAKMAFILIDAQFDEALSDVLKSADITP